MAVGAVAAARHVLLLLLRLLLRLFEQHWRAARRRVKVAAADWLLRLVHVHRLLLMRLMLHVVLLRRALTAQLAGRRRPSLAGAATTWRPVRNHVARCYCKLFLSCLFAFFQVVFS